MPIFLSIPFVNDLSPLCFLSKTPKISVILLLIKFLILGIKHKPKRKKY